MYAGRIVEQGSRREIFYDAQHPVHVGPARVDRPPGPAQAQAPDRDSRAAAIAAATAAGCTFGHRCASRFDLCAEQPPLLDRVGGHHLDACHLEPKQKKERRESAIHPELVEDAEYRRCRSRGRRTAAGGRAREEVLPDQERGAAAARDRPGARRRRRQPRAARRGDARPGRRVGVRQVHAGPVPGPAVPAHQRHRSSSRARTSPRCPGASCARCGARCRWSSRTRTRRSTRASASARSSPTRCASTSGATGIGQAPGAGAARAGRAVTGALQPLPARVLRRPAAADRGGPGACAAPAADHRRRAGLRPRRLDPGAGRQPARRPAGRAAAHLPLHRPRPGRGAPRVGPDRGHVPGQDRRDRRPPRISTSGRSTPTPRRCCPRSRSRTRTCPPPAKQIVLEGDVPSPIAAAVRLPLPPALPVRHRDLRRRPSRRWSPTAARATSPPATTR